MKALFAATLAIAALGSAATSADARPMHGRHHGRMVKVCTMHHHHPVCRMVRR